MKGGQLLINIDNIHLWRGKQCLLEQANALLYPDQHYALVGVNGSGKSSFFQLLLGELTADKGSVHLSSQWRLAHMSQAMAASQRSAIDYVIDGDDRLRAIEAQLSTAETNNDAYRIADLHQQLDEIDGYRARVRGEQMMQGLGFSVADRDKPVAHFSGGWRIRLHLAQTLMCPADVLLLDEPTNHLDMDATLWLEQWLQRYSGLLLLISHDRDFIDTTCDTILHIEHRQLYTYRGNYSSFERQRAERLAQQTVMAQKQARRVAEMERFVKRFRAKASKAKQAQSRLKALAKMEMIAPAHADSPFDFSFPVPERVSDPLLVLRQCALGYGQQALLQNVNLTIHPGSRIGLLGANGQGKSTLLKSLAGELTPLSGERVVGANVKIGYFSQHQLETLDFDASPLLHLQRLQPTASEQSIRNFLGGFCFVGESALQAVANFSGGEKARLALALIVWQKPNILLLDEPTNHLDLSMCYALTVALQRFSGAVVIVSHDRHLLRHTVDEWLLLNNAQLLPFEGDLEDYARWLLQHKRAEKKKGAVVSHQQADQQTQQQPTTQSQQSLNALKKQQRDAEKAMEKASAALATIEQQLLDPTLYDADHKAELQELLQRQGELKKQHQTLEETWLACAQACEEKP